MCAQVGERVQAKVIWSVRAQVGERVQAKVITGNKDMIRMFNFFASHGTGRGHAVIGFSQFLGENSISSEFLPSGHAFFYWKKHDRVCSQEEHPFFFVFSWQKSRSLRPFSLILSLDFILQAFWRWTLIWLERQYLIFSAGIAQKLGVYMTARESCALFGRYDSEVKGALTYFEFIGLFFDEVRSWKMLSSRFICSKDFIYLKDLKDCRRW